MPAIILKISMLTMEKEGSIFELYIRSYVCYFCGHALGYSNVQCQYVVCFFLGRCPTHLNRTYSNFLIGGTSPILTF